MHPRSASRMIFWAFWPILLCDLENDLVTLTMTFQGHVVICQLSNPNNPPNMLYKHYKCLAVFQYTLYKSTCGIIRKNKKMPQKHYDANLLWHHKYLSCCTVIHVNVSNPFCNTLQSTIHWSWSVLILWGHCETLYFAVKCGIYSFIRGFIDHYI